MQKNELDIYYDFLLDNAGVSDESLQLITNINGYNKKTLDDVLYCQTGYRSVEQFCDACDIENPFESEVTESVDKDVFIKQFRQVYPERDIHIMSSDVKGDKCVIGANFPDGDFYFVVTKNSVSSAYKSQTQALKSIASDKPAWKVMDIFWTDKDGGIFNDSDHPSEYIIPAGEISVDATKDVIAVWLNNHFSNVGPRWGMIADNDIDELVARPVTENSSVQSITNRILEGKDIQSVICEFGAKPSDYINMDSDEAREKQAAKELKTALEGLRKAFADAVEAVSNIYFDANDYFADGSYPFNKDFNEAAWDIDDWCDATIKNINRKLR